MIKNYNKRKKLPTEGMGEVNIYSLKKCLKNIYIYIILTKKIFPVKERLRKTLTTRAKLHLCTFYTYLFKTIFEDNFTSKVPIDYLLIANLMHRIFK